MYMHSDLLLLGKHLKMHRQDAVWVGIYVYIYIFIYVRCIYKYKYRFVGPQTMPVGHPVCMYIHTHMFCVSMYNTCFMYICIHICVCIDVYI